jgi:hypothetical protein
VVKTEQSFLSMGEATSTGAIEDSEKGLIFSSSMHIFLFLLEH